MAMTLVTGASGFVGSFLMAEMRRRGLTVRGLSRNARSNLVAIPSYGPEMDWSPYLDGVDTIIHLAARVHVMHETEKDPLAAFRQANVDATLNLARQAAAAGVRRFIFVSTIKVNGERTEPGRPFTADDPPNPQDAYGISKAEAEAALMALARETGLEVVIIRPPLVYGPGVGGNFRTLLKWVKTGLPSVFARVKNRRSLVYVGNLCDLLITVIDHPNAAGRIFLVSDGDDLSTHELLVLLAKASGRPVRSIPAPPALLRAGLTALGRRGFIDRLLNNLQVDPAPARERLGWSAPFPVVESLAKAVAAEKP